MIDERPSPRVQVQRSQAPMRMSYQAWAYLLAIMLLFVALMLHANLGVSSDQPLLVLFLAPVLVSAYFGGLWPGLFATFLVALLTNYQFLLPIVLFPGSSGLEVIDWLSMILLGILLSLMSEGLHSARRRVMATERLHTVTLNSLGDAVIISDSSGTVTFLNPEAERLTGWVVSEAVGQPLPKIFQIVHAQTRAAVLDPARQVLATGNAVILGSNIVLIKRDGSEIPIDDSAAPIKPADGTIEGVVLVFRDVSARERAETALRESEERFRLIVEGAQDYALFMLTPGGFVDSWNVGAERLKGYHADEIVGQHFACFYTPEDVARDLPGQLLARAVAEGHVEDEGWRIRKDGTRFWANVVITALYDALGRLRGFSKMTRDQTARRQAEAEVRSLNAELEERVFERTAALTAANRELEAFSYSVSHDLRAPLRAIDGFTRILQEEYIAALPEEAQHYFQLVRNSAQQMGQLIDDLLAFARLSRQPLSKRVVDPAVLVQQCLEELQGEQVGRQIEVQLGALPACLADPALLKQVWINLLANALKYTRKRAAATIELGSQLDHAHTVYFIRDNGVGFDMRYSDKLFGVFQRMHRAEEYEGTGVGLAIVQRIVHRHGGRIWAEAESGKGATFFFTLGEPES